MPFLLQGANGFVTARLQQQFENFGCGTQIRMGGSSGKGSDCRREEAFAGVRVNALVKIGNVLLKSRSFQRATGDLLY
jgi:hypothetical protein